MPFYRLLGFIISLIALILSLVWLGWKFTLVLWLALWANNLSMAARFGLQNSINEETNEESSSEGEDNVVVEIAKYEGDMNPFFKQRSSES